MPVPHRPALWGCRVRPGLATNPKGHPMTKATVTADAVCPKCKVAVKLSASSDKPPKRGDTVRITGTCPTCGQTVFHDQKV